MNAVTRKKLTPGVMYWLTECKYIGAEQPWMRLWLLSGTYTEHVHLYGRVGPLYLWRQIANPDHKFLLPVNGTDHCGLAESHRSPKDIAAAPLGHKRNGRNDGQKTRGAEAEVIQPLARQPSLHALLWS